MFSDPQKNIAQLGLQHGMHVADLGAGSGFYTFEAAKIVGGAGRVYAIEVQKELIDKLKKTASTSHFSNIEVIWGNVETIGGTRLRDGLIDRVIASNVLFQIEHRDNFVLEIKRILKSGGEVLVIDWSDTSAFAKLDPKMFVTKATAQLLFEKAGFMLDTSINPGEHHYGLIFKKP